MCLSVLSRLLNSDKEFHGFIGVMGNCFMGNKCLGWWSPGVLCSCVISSLFLLRSFFSLALYFCVRGRREVVYLQSNPAR